MSKIIFKVEVESPDAGKGTDEEEVENICECILDALGFPDNVTVLAVVLARVP